MGGVMVAGGTHPDVQAACLKLIHIVDATEPEAELVKLYRTCYQQDKQIYPALKNVFAALL